MEVVFQSLAEAERVNDRLLSEVVDRVCDHVARLVGRVERARMRMLQESHSAQREREMLHWVEAAKRCEEQIEHFEHYLLAKAENTPSTACEGERDLSAREVQRCLVLVRRSKGEVREALWKASLAQKQSNSLLSTQEKVLAGHNAVKSLLRTRAALSVEVQKVEGALSEIQKDAEKMETLRHSLLQVTDSMDTAKTQTRRLLAAHRIDSMILFVTALLFAITVVYILLHRLFGYFPVVVHV